MPPGQSPTGVSYGTIKQYRGVHPGGVILYSGHIKGISDLPFSGAG